MLRAAPKKRFGLCSAFESTPPERILPEGGTTVLYARARRVIESSRITTSSPCSTSRFARSMTISATCDVALAGSSKVDEMTSAVDVPLHVGHLFGALVDEQHHERDFGMVLPERALATLCMHHRLARARRRDDQRALAFAERREEVDDPVGEVVALALKAEGVRRVEGREVVEEGLLGGLLGACPLIASTASSAK